MTQRPDSEDVSADPDPPPIPSAAPAPGLYIVATPIGNLGDITLRALAVLRQATLIACEDTRRTRQLLAAHSLRAPSLIAYHEHNAERVRPHLLQRLREGACMALVSDAGTPLISDPGYRLVRACQEEGLAVTALPGASALLAALVLAGLPTDRFLFAGFPPRQAGKRIEMIRELASVRATLILYEAPFRLAATLADLAAVLGEREAVVARELTKRYEEVRRGQLPVLARYYADTASPRGEIVVLIGPPVVAEENTTLASGIQSASGDVLGVETAGEDLDTLLGQALGQYRVKEAANRVAAALKLPKRVVYQRALQLSQNAPSGGEGDDGEDSP